MQLFANNAISTLAGAISNVALTMSVQPGHGARFPSPVGGDYFLVTLFSLVNGIEANHEIVKVTARSVDTLTIVRGQEGTVARAFGVGEQVSGRLTAGTLAHLAQTDMPTTFTQPVTILTAAPGTNTMQAASTAFVSAAVAQGKADLVASSPAALDTLNEFAAALGNDANFATTTAASLGNRLRFDINNQGLTAPQKANAVANLGLAAVATTGAKADVGLGNVDNTSDVNKPVSTPTANALALKAPLASPSFTGGAVFNSASGTIPGVRVVGAGPSQGAIYFGTTNDLYKMSAGDDYIGAIFDIPAAKDYIFNIGGTARLAIKGGGNVLIGTTTDNGVDKLQVTGGVSVTGAVGVGGGMRMAVSTSAAWGAGGWSIGVIQKRCGAWMSHPTVPYEYLLSNNYYDGTNYRYIINGGAASFTFAGLDQIFTWGVAPAGTAGAVATFAERMRIDANGNLLVGAMSGTNHSIRKNVLSGELVLGIGPSAGESHRFYVADTGGANAAATVYSLDKIGGNGRSINAAGTLNASGADYAEYMRKSDTCGDIAKGDVIGVDANGELTNQWLDAVSFMVKTTNPSLVGGDTWGVGLEGDELEAARAKVDRIAYAGQVPVNVYGAKPGQFIVPARFGDKVGGVAVNRSDLDHDLYLRAVGIVQNILPDGRANIRVKVA